MFRISLHVGIVPFSEKRGSPCTIPGVQLQQSWQERAHPLLPAFQQTPGLAFHPGTRNKIYNIQRIIPRSLFLFPST